jgi:diaminopimelate epimerase
VTLPNSARVTRQFHKMQGLGNDFVVLDAREQPVAMTPALAKALADRQLGIGCDQLILLEPSATADVKMRIWNHDGGEVQSCGNASRCVVALTGAKSLETGGGIVEGATFDAEVEVSLPPPHFAWNEVPLTYPMDTASLPLAWGPLEHPMALSVGNPHLVFFVDDEQLISLASTGPSIEHDPAFPERINVNVASVRDDGIHLRTWERGSGLTLACGTGACATAVAAIVQKKVSSPVAVHMRGGKLTITWASGEPIRMRGTATHVFTGEIELEQFA